MEATKLLLINDQGFDNVGEIEKIITEDRLSGTTEHCVESLLTRSL